MKIKSNAKFCHYTTLDITNKILKTGKFFLNKFGNMNDGFESSIHEEDANKLFSLCLCNSDSLNIPLFYLYGGIDGKGCRIQLTDAKLNSIIEKCELFFVDDNNQCLEQPIDKNEYEILYDWIYYVSADGYLEHHNETGMHYSGFEEILTELKESRKDCFIKNLIWKYEKEFRIVVKFKKDIPYPKIAMSFTINNNEKGISIVCGPETTDVEFDKINKDLSKYKISKIEKSSQAKISMDLIKKNKWIYESL